MAQGVNAKDVVQALEGEMVAIIAMFDVLKAQDKVSALAGGTLPFRQSISRSTKSTPGTSRSCSSGWGKHASTRIPSKLMGSFRCSHIMFCCTRNVFHSSAYVYAPIRCAHRQILFAVSRGRIGERKIYGG